MIIGAIVVGAFSGIVVVGLWFLHLRSRAKYLRRGPPERLSDSSNIGDPLVRMHRRARKMTDPNRRKQ